MDISFISSGQEVDDILLEFHKQWKNQQFVILSAQRTMDSIESGATTLRSNITAVQGEISGYTTVIAALPAGPLKDDFTVKKTLAEHRLFALQQRSSSSYGQYKTREIAAEVAALEQGILSNAYTTLYNAAYALPVGDPRRVGLGDRAPGGSIEDPFNA